MEIMNVPCGTWITLAEDARVPPGAPPANSGLELKVLNLDGMYVNCVNREGTRYYIAAWENVNIGE